MTQKFEIERHDTSIERENENFLNDSGSNDTSLSDLSDVEGESIKIVNLNDTKQVINNRINKETLSDDNKVKNKLIERANDSQMQLVEESYDNSSSSSATSSDEDIDNSRLNKSPICKYFLIEENSHPNSTSNSNGCQHRKPLSQDSCLNCDFKKDLEDSLNHMAFYSPTSSEIKKNNFYDELKFDSPTVKNTELSVNHRSQTEETLLNDSTIVNETITEEDMENQESAISFIGDANRSEIDQSNLIDVSRLECGDRTSISMSEGTFVFSDHSDDSFVDEKFYCDKENKYEMKKKIAIEKSLLSQANNENDTTLAIRSDSPIGSNENWFTPYIVPPLESELNQEFKINNDPIVKYYKSDEKFKVVNKINLVQ
jgi:hypothetical protein